MRIRLALRGALLLAAVLSTSAKAASSRDSEFAAIRALDLTLGRIGWRLTTANAALCDQQEPGLGLVLQTPSQFVPAARKDALHYFLMDGRVGVEGVIAGSPAEAAGIVQDDIIAAIGAERFTSAGLPTDTSTAELANVYERIAALPIDKPLTVQGRHAGMAYAKEISPTRACRSRFEVKVGSDFAATADGTIVQIGSRFLELYPEEQAAVPVAHELAHNILHHRARLEAQKAKYGLLSGFGRSANLFRQTELEADILSITLLANAGYDPSAAVQFWRSYGPRLDGTLRLSTHPAWRDRVAVIKQAITRLGPEGSSIPTVLLRRDEPLNGDWQALLVGH